MNNSYKILLWNGWEIRKSSIETKYYITKRFDVTYFYLHRNGTIHDYCGPENFWESKEKAEKFFTYWAALEEIIDNGFITEDEMHI